MSKAVSSISSHYFSTRDLLIMAVLSALGGVSSTYVNTVGNAVYAALGVPGATQWAAGLHSLWIVLAMGILRKPGVGITTGILKGFVELMSGNTHGIIILLINLVAGLLVDLGFFIINNKQSISPYLIAGGLSAGSNVLIFQLFATLPSNILAYSAILLLTIIATLSGIIFSGIAPYYLINSLTKANVIKRPVYPVTNRKVGKYVLLCVLGLSVLLTFYLRASLRGSPSIEISGAVQHAFSFPNAEVTYNPVTRQMPYRGIMTEYHGHPLADIIVNAAPKSHADTLLLEASDGYAFLISFDELSENKNILIVQQGQGQNRSYDIVGPTSSKAWVRNVVSIIISGTEGLTISIDEQEIIFYPNVWIDHMDSTDINLPTGTQKLQGVPLEVLLEPYLQSNEDKKIIVKAENASETYHWQEITQNNQLRIFSVMQDGEISYALGTMSGESILYPVTSIEVQ